MSKNKIIKATENMVTSVTEGYEKIEHGVVDGYKKIEDGVIDGFGKVVDKCSGVMLNEDGELKTGKIGNKIVGGYQQIEHKFVQTFLAKDGETTAETKTRLAVEQKAREGKIKAEIEQRNNAQKEIVKANLDASKNAGKHH